VGRVYRTKELRKIIEADGWFFVRQSGTSYAQFKHPAKRGLVTIPIHDKDMKKGTSANVLRQAGLKISEV
jgi:predicted RNA binding protein YcfA (HicA-like mRNA interferase family)